MNSQVAARYAQALLEIGLEDNSYEKLRDELAKVNEVYLASEDLQQVLHNPSIKLDDRRALVTRIGRHLRVGTMITNFLQLLVVKGRIGEIPGIFNSLQSLTDTRAGVVRAQVTSAAKLAPNQVNAIKAALAKKTGKKVLVETEVDEALIGGVITRLGGKVYDGSIRTQLQAIRTAAAERV